MWWFVLVVALCLDPVASLARWAGPRDSKGRSELQKMEAKALFEEAFDVCVRRAQLSALTPGPEEAEVLRAAEEYLATIEDVVREASGGRLPQWMRSLSFARTTRDCQAVFRSFLGGETAPETKPAGEEATVGQTPGSRRTAVQAASATPRPTAVATQRRTATSTPVIRVPAFPILWFSPTPERRAPAEKPSPSPRPTSTPRPTRALTKATPMRSPTPQAPEVTDELPPWFR